MEGSGRVATVIGAVVAVVLQVVVAPNVSLGFAVPDFLLAYAVVVAVARAEHAGPALPFVLGLIFDLLGGGPVGAMAFVFVLVTFLASKAYSLLDNGTMFMPIALVVASLFMGEVLYGALLCSAGLRRACLMRSCIGAFLARCTTACSVSSCIRCACASWRKGGTPNPECRWSASEGGAPRCLSPSPQLS